MTELLSFSVIYLQKINEYLMKKSLHLYLIIKNGLKTKLMKFIPVIVLILNSR